MTRSQWLLLNGVCGLALLASPALAQDAAAPAGAEQASEEADIIVTARRQNERLQDVPVSVAVITADALHCQRKLARSVVEKGGEYVLQVKGNQPLLEERAKKMNATPGTPFLQ